MDPGKEEHYRIYAAIDPKTPTGTIIENVAQVNLQTYEDIQDYNNKVWVKSLVQTMADLSVTKFGEPDGEVNAGDELTYTVIVENNGPSYARDVLVQDLFRSDDSFELLLVTSSRNADCEPTSGVFHMKMDLECELWRLEVKDEENPGRWILTYVVKATSKQSINNVAEVRSQEPDPDLSNNSAEVQYQVNPVTDLSVAIAAKGEVQVNGQPAGTVSMATDQVTAGRSVEYVVTVKNDGVSTAENVVLEDVLPVEVTLTSIVASSGSCSAGLPGNPTICGLGNIASGASATVTIRASVLASELAGKVLVSNALVYSDVPDAENAFSFDTNLTLVNAWADLSVEMSNLTPDVPVGG
jgi:uncharacterized repeat protein (TIGR01451 family)